MSRMLATKASLSIRVDALSEVDAKSGPLAATIGIENRAKLESRLRALEHRADLNPTGRGGVGASYKKPQPGKFAMNGDAKTYNTAADSVELPEITMKPVEAALAAVMDVKDERAKRKEEKRREKEAKKEKKAKKDEVAAVAAEAGDMEVDGAAVDEEAAKKEKKRLKKEKKAAEEAAAAAASANGTKSKKRRADDSEEPQKKKKKKE